MIGIHKSPAASDDSMAVKIGVVAKRNIIAIFQTDQMAMA